MSRWLKLIWGGGYSDEQDDVTGLSERDVHHVQQSWAIVNKNKLNIGMDIFIRLFKGYPETKAFFKSFSSIPNEDLRSNAHFMAHVMNFMNGFGMIIEELKNPEVAIAMCNKIGNSHAPRNVKQGHFDAAKEVLVTILTEDLKVDSATISSWHRFITFMYSNVMLPDS